MSGTTEEFTKLKAGGRFAIYAFGIYLATTFTIGCLGVIIGSPLLTLPLTMLISHPIIWIAIGIALAVTYKVAIEPLYRLAKGCINGKGASKEEKSEEKGVELQKSQENTVEGKQKGSDGDSGIVPDSKPGSESSSRRNSVHSEDSGLGGKELCEDLPTLVHQTNRGKYDYQLYQHDIAHIARAVYNYSKGSEGDTLFCIPGDVNSLNSRLREYKVEQRDQRKIFTSIINLGGNHWVTLVVTYNDNRQFRAYYCDSFGNKLPNGIEEKVKKVKDDISLANEITEECVEPLGSEVNGLIRERSIDPDNVSLKEKKDDVEETLNHARRGRNKLVSKQIDTSYIVGVLQETLEIENDGNIRSSPTKQQNDGHNCGIFALENASKITQVLSEGKSFEEIDKELSEHKFDLDEKRREFAKALMNDEKWKEDLQNGLLCELLPGTQTSPLGVQNAQTCNAI